MLPGKKYTPIDIAAIVWRRKWFVAIPMMLGLYAALIVSSRLEDVYESEMLIQIVPQQVPDSFVRSTVTIRTEDRIEALKQQVMSRTELERLIEQMNLYPSARGLMPMQDLVVKMRNQIAVELVRTPRAREGQGADAFYVRFAYPNAEIAARVTQKIGGLFVDFNARDRGTLADATNDFLQNQLAQARRNLEERERKLEAFRQQNAGRLPSQLESNMQAINNAQLQLQALVESLARDRDRKLMLERIEGDAHQEPAPLVGVAPPSSPGPANDPAAADVGGSTAQQLAQARELLTRLQLRLKPEHPDIIRTTRLISELNMRAEQESEDAARGKATPVAAIVSPQEATRRDRLRQQRAEIESLSRQIAFKEAEEQRVRKMVEDYRLRIEQIPGVESEWVAVTRDYETQQASYNDLLTKSEQSRVAADLEKRQVGEQFRVLDPARPPVRPIGVKRFQINAAGAAAGLVFGLLFAAFLEFMDSSYRTSTEVIDVLKLPVIAMVPYVATAADLASQRRRWVMTTLAGVGAVAVGGYGVWAMQLWRHLR